MELFSALNNMQPDEMPLTLPELTPNLEPAVPGQSRASSVLVGPSAYSTSGAKIQQTKRAKQAGKTGLLEDGALQRFTSDTWVVLKPTGFSPTEDSFLAAVTEWVMNTLEALPEPPEERCTKQRAPVITHCGTEKRAA